MTDCEKLRTGYHIFLSVFTCALGFAYILSAANIYYSGPIQNGADLIYYSREIVWGYLKWLLIPTVIWIFAIIGGFILSVKMVVPAKKRNKQNALSIVERLQKRMPAQADGELSVCLNRVNQREKIRFAARGAVALYCIVAAIMCCVYVFDATNFPAADLTKEVLAMLARVLPWIAVAFVLTCCVMIYDYISAQKVLPDMKRLAASKGERKTACKFLQTASCAEQKVFSGYGLLVVRFAVAVVGVAFVVVGIANGGAGDVLAKAINICTECIGLG